VAVMRPVHALTEIKLDPTYGGGGDDGGGTNCYFLVP
jgi:hypothetical protein